MWFKKKKKEEVKKELTLYFDKGMFQGEAVEVSLPTTLAQVRLEQGAKDKDSGKALKMYNSQKTKIQNQWINPLQGINSGYGTAHLSTFLYQTVNYYECYQLSQDPMFTKIFNILSSAPLSKGGSLVSDVDYEKYFTKFSLWEKARSCLRSSYVAGGCLLYMDFGKNNLDEPLNLKKENMKNFKGFIQIDPINITAVDVNTIDPSKPDYMKPKKWFVIGLGVCDSSHFIHWEMNTPDLMLKPLTLYFGMPLTLLIKQDVANSNLTSQSFANLISRQRSLYLKTDKTNFATSNAMSFKARLETMGLIQNNFNIMPLGNEEEIIQLVTSLQGMADNVEFFYQLLSAKTGITMSMLMGKGAQGLSGTLEGERKNFNDQTVNVQEQIKPNLLIMMGICAGTEKGQFIEFEDFIFNPLEEVTEKELGENVKLYTESAKSLIEIGAKPEQVLEWLKSFEKLRLDSVDFDDTAEGLEDYDDITQEVEKELYKSNNEDSDIEWITVKGNHIPVKKGQSKEEAVESFIKNKEDSKKKENKFLKSYQNVISKRLKNLEDIKISLKDKYEKELQEYNKSDIVKLKKDLKSKEDEISAIDKTIEKIKEYDGVDKEALQKKNKIESDENSSKEDIRIAREEYAKLKKENIKKYREKEGFYKLLEKKDEMLRDSKELRYTVAKSSKEPSNYELNNLELFINKLNKRNAEQEEIDETLRKNIEKNKNSALLKYKESPLVSDFHQNPVIEFDEMPDSYIKGLTKIHQSSGGYDYNGSSYYLDYDDGKVYYVRVSDHFGKFSTRPDKWAVKSKYPELEDITDDNELYREVEKIEGYPEGTYNEYGSKQHNWILKGSDKYEKGDMKIGRVLIRDLNNEK